MGKLYLSAKGTAKRFRRRPKTVPNKKLATVGTVKRLINRNVNKQRSDAVSVNAANVTDTGTITAIDYNVSDDYIYDSMFMRIFINNGTLANVLVRIIVFQWKDTTTPVIGDLLSTANPLAPLGNPGDTSRTCGGKLHLLSDILTTMNVTDDNNRLFTLKYYKKRLLPLDSDTAESKNRVYVAYISNAAATYPVMTLYRSQVYHQN